MNFKEWKIIGVFALAGFLIPILLITALTLIVPHQEWARAYWLDVDRILFPGAHGVFMGFIGRMPGWWFIAKLWFRALVQNAGIYALLGLAIIFFRRLKNRSFISSRVTRSL
jgi:hypothetical protein